MRFYAEIITDYLDARFPDWSALIMGLLSGIVGVLALALLAGALFGVVRLGAFMPFIVGFCGAQAGFKAWEKSLSPNNLYRKFICALAGIGTGAAGFLTQRYIDQFFFYAKTPIEILLFLLIIGCLMAEAGGWLKAKSESLKGLTK
jgi:hypothetical protein